MEWLDCDLVFNCENSIDSMSIRCLGTGATVSGYYTWVLATLPFGALSVDCFLVLAIA